MSMASPLEVRMLKLINAERQLAGLSPLTFNGELNDAAEDHSLWMLEADVFSHTGAGKSSHSDRIADAGYVSSGTSGSGENIAYVSVGGSIGLNDEVDGLHAGLMGSDGHRANILNPNYTEIGIGIEQGMFGTGSDAFFAVMVTQNFAFTSSASVGTGTGAGSVSGGAVMDVVPVTDPVAEVGDAGMGASDICVSVDGKDCGDAAQAVDAVPVDIELYDIDFGSWLDFNWG